VRFLKKVVSVILLLSIILGITAAAYATDTVYYSSYAEKLSEIGVFKGTGTGFELEREPTRLEGLIMLIRLLGKEAEADKLAGEKSVFSDVPDWGRGYTNYAYKYGLAKGTGKGLFGSNEKVDAKSFVTFLLRALGYDDSEKSKDFTWNNAVEFAKSIGLLDEDLYFKIVSDKFKRDYVAKASYNALQQPLKNSSVTLIQKLTAAGVITREQADSLNSLDSSKAPKSGGNALSSVEIGKLARAVVRIDVVGYDNTQWTGSGFYVSADGNIVTNFHVIEGAKSLSVTDSNGNTYNGSVKIIGYNADDDIAVLDIDKTPELYLKPGNSDNVVLGENVYAIGYPLGLQVTISGGIVSSLWPNGIIQTTAPISHGNSGGVLLNDRGQAVGITYGGIEDGENLGFAIPINKYVNLSKNMSLTLADLYKTTVRKPVNVSVIQTSKDAVSIYWDPVSGADYYYVYMAETADGPYTRLADNNGSERWQWRANSCIISRGLEPGNTYYFKVTSVDDSVESIPSEVASVTLYDDITYEDFESLIMDNYGVLKCGDYTTAFSKAEIMETSNGNLHIFLYLKVDSGNYFSQFLDIMIYNSDEFEYTLASMASLLAGYYGKDVSATVIYARDGFYDYPDAFAENDLYSDTIDYDSGTGTWSVFYPYVTVTVYDDNTYDAAWAY